MTVAGPPLAAATQGVERLGALARRLGKFADGVAPDAAALDGFRAAMDDDLDTPRATAQMFELVTAANALADRGDQAGAARVAAAVFEMASAFGLGVGGPSVPVDEAASMLASERDEARRRKDFARADALRAELQARGWIVEDTPHGTMIRR